MKRKVQNLICLAALITMVASSCAPAYVANVVNTPLLSNKGEIQAAIYTGTSGFDPQLTYAASNHIGLMFNGSFANFTSDTTDNFHRHQFIEFGTGYYENIGRNGRFETFGGFGFGSLQAEYSNSLWQSKSSVSSLRFFIQPTVGLSTAIFDGSIATRFVLVKLYQGSEFNTGVFAEPVLTGKLGFKNVKAVMQLGFSIPVNSNNIEFNNQPFMFSIGLQGTLKKIY